MVEPEVVATSPYPIKSRVPVCCGFSSKNWWAREDLHLQGSQILDLWGLLFPLNHSPKNWSPHPELHQAGLLTEQAHRSKCFGGA